MSSKNTMKRRDFLKIIGVGTAAVSSVAYTKASEKAPFGMKAFLSPEGTPQMTMRTDAAGEKISLLGYGGMRWPTKQTGGNTRGEIIDQDKVNGLIEYAMKHGINYYDTAPVYHGGQSEHAMGIALSNYPRESFHIATKLSNFDASKWTLENAKEIYENSFKQLGVDYIDFYLLHSVGPGKDSFDQRFVNNGILDFLVSERQKGKIKHLGFSFHGDRESFLHALNSNIKWDFVQIQLNYFDWTQDADNKPSASYMYEEHVNRHLPVVVMEPLLGGRLAKLNDKILAELKKRDPELSPASWAFRFVGSLPGVLTTLSGMTYMEHLKEDITVFSPLKAVTDADKNFLQETAVAMMKYPVIPCTGCRYCMPCPFGLDIPANFAYFNKCLEAGNIPASKQSANYVKAREAFLGNFSKSVREKKQSIHCTACGHCLPLCPQHIKIPDQMKRINTLVQNLKNNTL